MPDDVQVVLCAGAPDTPEIGREVRTAVEQLQRQRDGVIWIDEMLPRERLVAVLDACTAFVCPSVYEPLGIVNLEAMAVGLPVVATATGGIPEVVAHQETGLLVPIDQVDDGTGTPRDSERFVADLADAMIAMVSDPARAARMGAAGRERAAAEFSWETIGERTLTWYGKVLAARLSG